MKKMNIRFLSLILALAMALSLLTGCQSSKNGDEKPAESSQSTAVDGGEGDASAEDPSIAPEGDEDYEIDGTNLVAYIGFDTETTTPSNVDTILNSAFSGDMGHGEDLKKVTITGNIKRIDDGAFSFTAADEIYIEEGCESLGHSVFSDSYIAEIWFPSSITEIGAGIMETEEGLWDTKIHVVEGSEIAKYFEENMPYGECELLYDYQ